MITRLAFIALLFAGMLCPQLPKNSVGGGGGSSVGASTDLTDSTGLVRGAAGLTTNNKLVEVSTTDGTVQEVSNQTANYVYAGAVSGGAAAPAFRALVGADIPAAVVAPASMAASTFASQTDSASVTWAIASVLNAQATLTLINTTATRALNITNPVVGGNYVVILTQDATGGAALTLGSGCGAAGTSADWLVAGGGAHAVTLTAAANAVDVLTFIKTPTNCIATLIPNVN